MLGKMSLGRKFLLAVAGSVIAAISVLTLLTTQREAVRMGRDYARNAEIIAATIGVAIHDNMLGGRADDTLRLIDKLKRIEGVQELAVLKADGRRAFGISSPAPELPAGSLPRLLTGEDVALKQDGSQYLIKPLVNSGECRACHSPKEKIRGILLVKMSTADMLHSTADLSGRMFGFGLVTALFLSGLLVVMGRRLLIIPLQGLTEATRQIASGTYVTRKPRGTNCREMLGCDKDDCPSYGGSSIPCWLESGTLCNGEPSGKFALRNGDCEGCIVYKELRGDEIVQLQDNFNRMSLTLDKQEQRTAEYIDKIEGLNRDLESGTIKLSGLLEASRLTTATLEPEHILSTSMKLLRDATGLKTGVVLLLDEDPLHRCHEFFACQATDCPAHRAEVDCWRLPGTVCSECLPAEQCAEDDYGHGRSAPAMTPQDKFEVCSRCRFFSEIVLTPRMTSGLEDGCPPRWLKIESVLFHSVLLTGRAVANRPGENPLGLPVDAATELVLPLKAKDRTMGVIYLASGEEQLYAPEEIQYFQLLADVMSSGIFNSLFLEEMEVSYLQTVTALANAIEAKDPYTRGHSERVAEFSERVADVLNFTRLEKEQLRFAAVLHDIGKIGIERDLIRKQGRLSEAEEFKMRSHPEWGVQILEPVRFLRPILSAIRHHHEKFDGSGYPHGLRGGAIPLNARIISIADAWDAMRSDRPYRKALSIEQAIEELRCNAGSQFDPEIVELVLYRFRKSYP